MIFINIFFCFFFNDTATTEIYTLSLHDALPILACEPSCILTIKDDYSALLHGDERRDRKSTRELQSPYDLVCRLRLEKKKQPVEARSLCTKQPPPRRIGHRQSGCGRDSNSESRLADQVPASVALCSPQGVTRYLNLAR